MNDQIKHYENKLAFEMDPSDLFSALEQGEDIVVIDTRQAHGFEKEHIPGAINLPHRQMSAETTKDFSRTATYVCYCDGIGCNASTKGSLNMTRLGFKVRELIGGIEWWKLDGYKTAGQQAAAESTAQCAC